MSSEPVKLSRDMDEVQDPVEAVVAQWGRERPDLDLATMADVARVLRVAQLINGRIDALATEHGVDRGQGDVLFTLRRAGAPYRLSPGQLSENLLVTTGTMTNRLDRLERRGLIRRLPNPDDRRGLVVELTEEARELVDAAVERHLDNEREMLTPLTERDRAQLAQIMRKLLVHLST
jgi:DNA-binding MarR family transcriptional regulator